MARNTTPLGLAGLLLLAASLVLLWLVILSGLPRGGPPLDRTYFLRADTSGIAGARDTTHWAYFYLCGAGNLDCDPARPAPPFGAAWAPGADGAPDALVGPWAGRTTASRYFFMWRFAWVFLLITLFCLVVAFFAGFLACCGRVGAAVAAMASSVTAVFYTLSVVLTTVVFVQAQTQFRLAGRSANIGSWAFGFLWGSYAALLVAALVFLLATCGASRGSPSARRRGGVWPRHSSSRASRASRTRSYDGRRVKENYS